MRARTLLLYHHYRCMYTYRREYNTPTKKQYYGKIKNDFFFKNEVRLITGGRAIKDDGSDSHGPRRLRDSNIFRWAAKN